MRNECALLLEKSVIPPCFFSFQVEMELMAKVQVIILNIIGNFGKMPSELVFYIMF